MMSEPMGSETREICSRKNTSEDQRILQNLSVFSDAYSAHYEIEHADLEVHNPNFTD